MNITIQQLSEILHENPNPVIWLNELNTVLPKWNIDTPKRVAAFLAQCAHESVDFTHVQENLNYSSTALLAVFPKYFDANSSVTYARHPMMIGNRVYADRMSNGNEASGDGYKYRGRGLIQITGKANYHTYSDSIYGTDSVVYNPDLLLQPHDAVLSACWYWNSRNLNSLADVSDMQNITRKINGGLLGLDDRLEKYKIALQVLAA